LKAATVFYDYSINPSVFINKKLVRGELTAEIAVSAICDALIEPPKSCKHLHYRMQKDTEKLLKAAFAEESNWKLIFYLAVCFVGLYMVFHFSRKYFKRRLV